MKFAHIHTFIPYAILGAGLILVVSFLLPKGLDGTQWAPTAMWQTTMPVCERQARSAAPESGRGHRMLAPHQRPLFSAAITI